MAIVSCSECGASVSTGARVCPNCGYSPNEKCYSCWGYDGYDDECKYCGKTGDDSACPGYSYADWD